MELSRDQIDRLKESIGPMVRYPHRLQGRMDVVGFVPSDHLYRLVSEAFDAVHALSVELHYLGTEAGRRGKK
jgi:hypothetical protein